MMPQQQQQPPPLQQTTTAAEAVAAAHAAGPGPLHVSSGMGGMPMNLGGSNEPGMGQQPGMGGPMGNMDISGMSPGGPMKGTHDESNGPGNMINNPNKMGRLMAGEVLCVPSPLPMSEDFIQDVLRNVEEDAKKHSLYNKRIEEEQNTKKEIFKMRKNKIDTVKTENQTNHTNCLHLQSKCLLRGSAEVAVCWLHHPRFHFLVPNAIGKRAFSLRREP